MKVWITKYALTSGIEELEVTESTVVPGLMTHQANGLTQYFHRRDYRTTKESALLRAEGMRRDKLRSLRNQIDKLEQLKFT